MRGQILFDNTKAETAGNADWIIDTHQPIPSPTISNIVPSSAETYWTGALSSWGVALAKLRNAGQISLGGDGLETLPSGGRITYGDGTNPQDLSHYQVYVVCEPNILFSAAEKTAIVNFVKNGGGLFMVADHAGSDRNNDGADSLQVWNDLMTNNVVQNNPFGFLFNSVDISPNSPTADGSASNAMTHGIGGIVTTLAYSSGTTMTINNATTTHAAVWSASSTTGVMALYGTFGSGRFAAIGDSSVVEDVTSSGGTTYAGWTTPADNGYSAINGTVWLLGGGSSNSAPSITTTAATGVGTTSATLNGTVNPNGQSTTVQFDYGLTTSYGLTVPGLGTFTGNTAQAVSATVTGLTPGATYHYRATATNASGSVTGLDQAFTNANAAVVDLAITKSHVGSFTQGDVADIYMITVTNVGVLVSAGTVTVVDVLPPGLTATAISGSGWSTNLATLTCTRSDSLAAGAAYPPIILTVTVASNAPGSVTNVVSVSGGGDAIPANNTASDITGINATGGGGSSYTGVLAGWDVSNQTAFGVSPLAPTTNAAHLTVGGLTRGSGVGITGSASASSWGGNTWNTSSEASAIAANEFATFSFTVQTGFKVSVSTINQFDYRRSGSGPTSGELQYQIGSGAFIDLAPLSYTSTSGASLSPIDLSGVFALQNIGAGTNVAFRIVNWGATSSGGTWYIPDLSTPSSPDFAISGTVTSLAPLPLADLTVVSSHAAAFTQGDTGDVYSITVTNVGNGSSTGTVSVVDTLPSGLTAAALGGGGWTCTLSNLTCTRSDILAPGATYPPITLTVNVSASAPANVTNLVNVSGGGETNLANNGFIDPTTIFALTPIQGWRLQWFGTTSNAGSAADTFVATSDGMPNLLKYALGLNPLVATNSPVVGDITTGYLRLTAPKNPVATDVSFFVEVTGDLTTSWATNGTTIDQDSSTVLQVQDDVAVPSATSRFIRLRVTRP